MVGRVIREQVCISVYPRHRDFMQANKGKVSGMIRDYVDSMIMHEGNHQDIQEDYKAKQKELEQEMKEITVELQTIKLREKAMQEAAKKSRERIKEKQKEENKKNTDKTRKFAKGMKESGALRDIM